jgi:MscS family membrane protein
MQVNPCYALDVALVIFLFLVLATQLQAQLPKSSATPPANGEPATTIDPLGRETPRSTVIGFLKCAGRHDYTTAARYLQPTPGQDTDLARRAEELQELHTRFKSRRFCIASTIFVLWQPS